MAQAAAPPPNAIVILADDLGYGDLGCYGGEIATPSLDRLAAEGVRFTQGYCASPICSPSRVGITTGLHPSKSLIFSYLQMRKQHRAMGMRDYLDPAAPSMARAFRDAGYATAHFGKWHMGGGRDVGDAPLPAAYGFDESLTSFEGLGDRVLPPGKLSEMNAALGQGNITRAPQHMLTEIYTDRAIEFMRRNRARPFFLNLWPNDVHDPFEPKPELLRKYERFASNKYVQQYYAMLDEMDRQIGRLMDELDRLGVAGRTLIVFMSDNGPTAWERYYKEGFDPPGRTGGLRGRKWSLYEGGIRVPFLARWPDRVPAGRVDNRTVISSLDLFPTFAKLARFPARGAAFDGEDQSRALFGRPQRRTADQFWEYGRDASFIYPGKPDDRSPNLAIRSGRWKALMNSDGSRAELYDLASPQAERNNVIGAHKSVASKLTARLAAWRNSLPTLK